MNKEIFNLLVESNQGCKIIEYILDLEHKNIELTRANTKAHRKINILFDQLYEVLDDNEYGWDYDGKEPYLCINSDNYVTKNELKRWLNDKVNYPVVGGEE